MKNVVGVDIVAEAIRDARRNAEINEVTNCSYYAGKAEDILSTILRDIDNKVRSIDFNSAHNLILNSSFMFVCLLHFTLFKPIITFKR